MSDEIIEIRELLEKPDGYISVTAYSNFTVTRGAVEIGFDPHTYLAKHVSAAEARRIAAALVRAADEIEPPCGQGCSERGVTIGCPVHMPIGPESK